MGLWRAGWQDSSPAHVVRVRAANQRGWHIAFPSPCTGVVMRSRRGQIKFLLEYCSPVPNSHASEKPGFRWRQCDTFVERCWAEEKRGGEREQERGQMTRQSPAHVVTEPVNSLLAEANLSHFCYLQLKVFCIIQEWFRLDIKENSLLWQQGGCNS